MKRISVLLLSAFCLLSLSVHAQNFRGKQRSQEHTIKIAYKAGRITDKEYDKLMKEQDIIKETIDKYESDNYLTPHEKNVIHEKLVRAEKRLKRYKTNWEN